MTKHYAGIQTRFLKSSERLLTSREETLPLVIEPSNHASASAQNLQIFLAENSQAILQDIATYGAVLLRGFNITNTKLFEDTILSIQGMTGMSNLFMSEPGRTRVDDLKFVYHTNTKIKTGGALHLGGFHNENYYSTDVPNYISFCCINPPKMGGETGLINMARVYAQLNVLLKEKLEKQAYLVAKWPVHIIAQRYQLDADTVKKVCSSFGLSVEQDNFIVMHKPSVLLHPMTGQKVIQANLCAEVNRLNDEVLKYFISDYKGLTWLAHKFVWRMLGYQKLRSLSLVLPELTKHPIRFLKSRKQIKQRLKQYNQNAHLRIGGAFLPDDISELASLFRECYAAFTWQKGDILLIDNLQIAHAGMPGKTSKMYPRDIRAMMCNPLKLTYTKESQGLQSANSLSPATLGEMLSDLSR